MSYATELYEHDVTAEPINQFARWFEDAKTAGLVDHTAMNLNTVTPDGKPDARIVLLKEFDAQGFVFYTNYESRKGLELVANTHACLLFFWDKLARQVRIEGVTEKVTAAESDEYFAIRPRESQLGAWASAQSQVLSSRAEFEAKLQAVTTLYEGKTVPRPPHWGGYRLKPEVVEFWQGRASRLHDRLVYRAAGAGWHLERLSP